MKAARRAALTVLAGLFFSGSRAAVAQTTGRPAQPLVINSMYGRDLFVFYCSSCHGRDGKGGGGAAAPAAAMRPPDLTSITARNGDVFPRGRVAAIIRGDASLALPAHGSEEMPVWGAIFQSLDPRDAMNTQRISNIVDYLESIQVR